MAKRMKLRKAHKNESQILTAISFSSKRFWNYPEEYFDIWKGELTITPEYIGNNKVFVVERDSSPVAYYSIIHLASDTKIADARLEKGFWLEHMFVLPEYIGKNIGTTMISHLISFCKKDKVREICVLADPHAKEFYIKMGFYFERDYPSTIYGRTTPMLRLRL